MPSKTGRLSLGGSFHSFLCNLTDFLQCNCEVGGERGIRTPIQSPDSLGETGEHTEKDAEILVTLCHDLAHVVSAWAKLPALLKAAILAIINSASAPEGGDR